MTSLMESFEEWAHLRHHHTSAGTPAAPATIEPEPQEDHVNLATLKTEAKAFADKLEGFDEDALNALEAVTANPVAASIFKSVASLAGIPEASTLVAGVEQVLRAAAPKPAQAAEPGQPPAAPQFTPAGPQVGGQA